MKLYREIIHPIRIPFNRRKSTSISFVQRGFELLPLPSRLSAPKTERSVIRSRLPPLECLLNNPLISIVTHVKRGGEREREFSTTSRNHPPWMGTRVFELQTKRKKEKSVDKSFERKRRKKKKKKNASRKISNGKSRKRVSNIGWKTLSLSFSPLRVFELYKRADRSYTDF